MGPRWRLADRVVRPFAGDWSWCSSLCCRSRRSRAGQAAYNADLLRQHEDPVSWLGYATSAEFWNRTTQNWQSEFLAVASMAAFAIYLRQRGSPESKLVGAAHDTTAQDS